MLSFEECKRDNLCVDCDDEKCLHAGKAMSDCPKYTCDNKIMHDCTNCEFLKDFTQKYKEHMKQN